jgi:spermidine synthase
MRGRTQRLVLLVLILGLSAYEVYGRTSGAINDLASHFSGDDTLERRFGTVIFQEQSRYGRVTVGTDLKRPGSKTLFINYRDMCRSAVHRSETSMASIVNLLLRPRASVLNIGLGCGFTASELASHPSVAKLGIVEINSVVAKASREYFRAENNDVQGNPKTALFLMDGARFLRTHDETFDAILVDIEEITVIYSSPLYTREYFEIIKKRLKPGGIFALWSYNAGNPVSKILLNTAHLVFPNVRIRILDHAIVLFASDSPLDSIAAEDDLEAAAIAQIETTPVTEINTLDHRVLENHYNMRAVFGFPAHYQEPFVRDPVQTER